jgi:hypothetical protein
MNWKNKDLFKLLNLHELAWNVMKDYFEYQEILYHGLEMLQEKLFKRIDSGWGTMDGNDKRSRIYTYL